jgi:hypothetical protein
MKYKIDTASMKSFYKILVFVAFQTAEKETLKKVSELGV